MPSSDKRTKPSGSKGNTTWKTLRDNVTKTVDQSHPLILKKAPFSIILCIGFLVTGSFIAAFVYQLQSLLGDNCTRDNQCVVCTVTLEELDGQKCTELATPSLQINTGCLSLQMKNDFDAVNDIIENGKKIVDKLYAIPGMFNERAYESFTRHYDLVKNIQKNDRNALIDMDPSVVEEWLEKNFMGFSLFLLKDILADVNIGSNRMIALGNQILYSYLTMVTTMWSAMFYRLGEIQFEEGKKLSEILEYDDGQGNTGVGAYLDSAKFDSFLGNPENFNENGFYIPSVTLIYDIQDKDAPGVDKTINTTFFGFRLSGGVIQAPTSKTGVFGNVDPSIKDIGKTYQQHGLSDLFILALPLDYIIDNVVNTLPPLAQERATVEMVYFQEFAGGSNQEGVTAGEPRHCGGASVFTNMPATLKSDFYECCAEKTLPAKLAESQAFAGFILSCMIVLTGLLFFPFQGDNDSAKILASMGLGLLVDKISDEYDVQDEVAIPEFDGDAENDEENDGAENPSKGGKNDKVHPA